MMSFILKWFSWLRKGRKKIAPAQSTKPPQIKEPVEEEPHSDLVLKRS